MQISALVDDGGDLTGTTIRASKPVLALAGIGRTTVMGTTADHVQDILLPIDKLWYTYYIISTPRRLAGDVLRITGL